MSVYLQPLASGSAGNALLVGAGGTHLLIDAGVPRRRLAALLAEAGLSGPEDLSAVLLTHTHGDHFRASSVGLCLAGRVPVYASAENLAVLRGAMAGFERLEAAGLARPMDGRAVVLGDEVVAEAFPVPHDAPGTCHGFRLTLGRGRRQRSVALATDLGHLPAGTLPWFLDADAVVLESNHDPEMLRRSGRPADLVRRIAGPRGHLSNGEAAEALAEIVGRSHPGRPAQVVLAHLSEECNRVDLALRAQAFLARRAGNGLRLVAARQRSAGPRLVL